MNAMGMLTLTVVFLNARNGTQLYLRPIRLSSHSSPFRFSLLVFYIAFISTVCFPPFKMYMCIMLTRISYDLNSTLASFDTLYTNFK
ncbi:hypothetical protein BLOT_011999 [Blomia tropicalis]|nr:hypothetical protein BLOT_011999 [Blomia tropicalis]